MSGGSDEPLDFIQNLSYEIMSTHVRVNSDTEAALRFVYVRGVSLCLMSVN